MDEWEARLPKGMTEHQTRMYFDAAYKAKITGERQIRKIKREFLDRICEALEHGPYAEFLRTEFKDEVEEPDWKEAG